MTWRRTSTVGAPPADSLGDALAEALDDFLVGATVELVYAPADGPPPDPDRPTAPGPEGWRIGFRVHPNERVARLVASTGRQSWLDELWEVAPIAAGRAATQFRRQHDDGTLPFNAPLRRAVRDTVAAEILTLYLASRTGRDVHAELIGEALEFLVELSGTRIEGDLLTHGVVITDVLKDTPRLQFAYPADIRAAKRAPLLFDGQRSVLVVDAEGRARTELQRHRVHRLVSDSAAIPTSSDDWVQSGSLVAEATRVVGGVGLFLRADRSIWSFVDGRPLLMRRGEHWSAFPLELSTPIQNMIGDGSVAALIARAAFLISALPHGAILAVVNRPDRLDGIVPAKDRYDLRDDIDPDAMRIETRLHHLIDAEQLDEQTLVRLAIIDGATILDREGHLLAYGAIVTSTDSEHEGARTAAARTLSKTAEIVLNVSVDGDITVFREGAEVTRLLARTAPARRRST